MNGGVFDVEADAYSVSFREGATGSFNDASILAASGISFREGYYTFSGTNIFTLSNESSVNFRNNASVDIDGEIRTTGNGT